MHEDYYFEGERRALSLGNRGPMAFDANGALAAGVAEAYWESGFYVFEGAVRGDELNELVVDFEEVLARAPASSTSRTDTAGRPAIGSEFERPSFRFARPLSDPYGGTSVSGGRYQAKMVEPEAPVDAPDEVLLNISSPLQLMDAALQLYGHPDLLRIAEQINGPDFTPFSESIWVKQPGWGPSVAWHQDGTTHWDNPDSGRWHPRIQLHGAAVRKQAGQRALGGTGNAQAGQDRHQGTGGGEWRLGPAARRGADGVPAG